MIKKSLSTEWPFKVLLMESKTQGLWRLPETLGDERTDRGVVRG
jgi:hypothetical protein